ncbi:21656_t:CDS:1 [Dentiscutata erythropus]|uniref:21656_t:CDS:1 n=1 Tax=Dentiscutata erythropus TaxID=1348616 RepID=A0A9N9B8T5_9GLOM|nr:21656_t:CDS:1 [Dentiscutata erythropus]
MGDSSSWNNETDWEDYTDKMSEVENESQKYDWKEELTHNQEHERYYQDLLYELALKSERVITWSTIHGYYKEPLSNSTFNSEVQPMDIDETYLIDMPQWGEVTEGLEVESNFYKDIKYNYDNIYLNPDQHW